MLAAFMLSACGKMNLHINKHDILGPISFFSMPTAAEITSGSIQDQVTSLNGYHVNASAGTMLKEVQATSTLNSYQIRYGLDGELLP